MPKIKILFFSHSSYLFGAENCLLSLVKSLDTSRFESVVVLPSDGVLRQKLDDLGIRHHIFPLEWWVQNEGRFLFAQSDLLQRLDQLLRIVANEQPDVIHSNTSVVWLGAVVARLLNIKHVWHLHELLVGHPSLEPSFPLPLLYQTIDFLSEAIVVVSDELRRDLIGYAAPEKLQVIHNGASPPPETELGTGFRSEVDPAHDRIIAVTVTSLQKYKGVEHLISAAAQAVKGQPNLLFVIAGTGPQEAIQRLYQQIQDLGLEESVKYLGYRKDAPRLVAMADMFVLPSLKEAFPLVVLEAMSHGKPVISTDCGGTAEMVVDGQTGYLVPVADPAALAEKIVELAKDSAKMETMGLLGQKRFLEHFTLDRYIKSFEDLYLTISNVPKPPASAKELSLLKGFIASYEKYTTAIRCSAELPEVKEKVQYITLEREKLTVQLSKQARDLDTASHLIQSQREEIAYRDGELDQLRKELVRAAEDNIARDEKHKHELSLATKQQAELENELQKKRVELADLREVLEQIQGEIIREGSIFEREIRQKDEEIRRQRDELRSAAGRLDSAVADFDRVKASREAERIEYEERILMAEMRIQELLNSKSWKITAPLRKLLDTLNK